MATTDSIVGQIEKLGVSLAQLDAEIAERQASRAEIVKGIEEIRVAFLGPGDGEPKTKRPRKAREVKP